VKILYHSHLYSCSMCIGSIHNSVGSLVGPNNDIIARFDFVEKRN